MIVPKSILYLSLLPALIEGGIRGLRSEDRVVTRSLQMTEEEDDLETEYCKPVPIFVDEFGLDHYSTEKLFAVYVEGANSKNADGAALTAAMSEAYNRRVDCSYSLGSTRALANCEVVTDAVEIVDDAVLVECQEYSTNSADGAVFLGKTKQDTCDCSCEKDGEEQIFKQLVLDEVCDCFCGKPSEKDCLCPAPYYDRFIKVWNRIYQEATANETNVLIVDLMEVTLLAPDDCESGEITTFNKSFVCPGNKTAALGK